MDSNSFEQIVVKIDQTIYETCSSRKWPLEFEINNWSSDKPNSSYSAAGDWKPDIPASM